MAEAVIGVEGMKIDRMVFDRFEETIRENDFIAATVEAGQWDKVIDYVNREVFEKPQKIMHYGKKEFAKQRWWLTEQYQ